MKLYNRRVISWLERPPRNR